MILGVIVVSSEYTSTGEDAPGARQLTETLTAVPDQLRLLAAKTAALTLVVPAQVATTADRDGTQAETAGSVETPTLNLRP
ncbi:MAG TPA: hypothetical protein VLL08_04260 [Kineosporiaceae bacterium]|nr:hypothetical protein [Kineosporiaceae bacterium]